MKNTKFIIFAIFSLLMSAFIANAVGTEYQSDHATAIAFTASMIGSIVLGLAFPNQAGLAFACSSLTMGHVAGCTNNPVAGLEYSFYAYNRSDIDLTATTFGTDGEIDNLVLTAPAVGYKFTAKGTANDVQIDMVEGKFTNDQWSHIFNTVVFDNTAATKKNIIKKFPSSDLVIVYENKWKGLAGASAFEAAGWSVGMTGKAVQRKSNDAETQGAWKVSLGTPKEQTEDNPAINVFDTDYATTKAMLEATLTP